MSRYGQPRDPNSRAIAEWMRDIERRVEKLERVGSPAEVILLEHDQGAEAVPPETLVGTIIVRKRPPE